MWRRKALQSRRYPFQNRPIGVHAFLSRHAIDSRAGRLRRAAKLLYTAHSSFLREIGRTPPGALFGSFDHAGAPESSAEDTAAMDQNIAFLIMMGVLFVIWYFLLIRPQLRRQKAMQEMLAGLKRGDTVVTSGGLIGKIRSVTDDEVRLELAQNVEVRVVRGMIADVRNKTEPTPANDSKAEKS
jgi:preprotein translocase subunit YajC